MRNKIVAVLSLAAGALVAAGASSQSNAAPRAHVPMRSEVTRIHLTGGQPGAFGGVTQHRGRDTAGDSFTIAATLYKGTVRVGTYDAICFTTLADRRVLCDETLSLAHGQIETQASESEKSSTNTAAIVGGTGAYRHASGTVTITDKADGNAFVVSLHR